MYHEVPGWTLYSVTKPGFSFVCLFCAILSLGLLMDVYFCVRFSFFSTCQVIDWEDITPAVSQLFVVVASCLQCFDAVGWAAGRASGL